MGERREGEGGEGGGGGGLALIRICGDGAKEGRGGTARRGNEVRGGKEKGGKCESRVQHVASQGGTAMKAGAYEKQNREGPYTPTRPHRHTYLHLSPSSSLLSGAPLLPCVLV